MSGRSAPLLDRILSIGCDVSDPPDTRRLKRLYVGFALALLVVSPFWSGVYLAFDEPQAALVPLLYWPLTVSNIGWFSRSRDLPTAAAGTSMIMLTLPFLLHVTLGGFQLSSGVVLWSFLAPLCALVFGRARSVWLLAFVAAVLIAALLPPRAANGLPEWLITAFFFANIATISAVAFWLLSLYSDQLAAERARSDRLLLNVLPAPIAARLRERHEVIADAYDAATIIFADVVNSTPLTVELSPTEMVALLDEHVTAFDALADRHGIEKIRTIGDNWMGVAGVPQPRPDHAQAAARLALGMLSYVADRRRSGARCLEFRIGLCSGPLVGGVIGRRKFVFDIWGDAVNTAARMESHGSPGRIQIAEPTFRLLGDAFICEPRGSIEVKGKGTLATWWLTGERGMDPNSP